METAQSIPCRDVFVVDDDPTVHDVLSAEFSFDNELRIVSFTDGDSFLAAAKMRLPACVLLDINMPGRSGLEVLKEMKAKKYSAPVLMLSGQNDVPVVVSAMKFGAHDYIEKPFTPAAIVSRVQQAMAALDKRRGVLALNFFGQDSLTPREYQVLARIAEGASNKETGRSLGISVRTVEVHRSHILEKLCAKNTADLIRMAVSGER